MSGFKKNGQIKVTQNPDGEIKKLASEEDEEYGVDNLIEDSEKENEDVNDQCD